MKWMRRAAKEAVHSGRSVGRSNGWEAMVKRFTYQSLAGKCSVSREGVLALTVVASIELIRTTNDRAEAGGGGAYTAVCVRTYRYDTRYTRITIPIY